MENDTILRSWYIHPMVKHGPRFDGIHHDKAEEARNVRVALAIDGFNPYRMLDAPYTCWPMFVIPFNLHLLGILLQR
jgi:phosphatidylserine/phosphatidylglycerophosphate/cardiolipin synthase-like enzyme